MSKLTTNIKHTNQDINTVPNDFCISTPFSNIEDLVKKLNIQFVPYIQYPKPPEIVKLDLTKPFREQSEKYLESLKAQAKYLDEYKPNPVIKMGSVIKLKETKSCLCKPEYDIDMQPIDCGCEKHHEYILIGGIEGLDEYGVNTDYKEEDIEAVGQIFAFETFEERMNKRKEEQHTITPEDYTNIQQIWLKECEAYTNPKKDLIELMRHRIAPPAQLNPEVYNENDII